VWLSQQEQAEAESETGPWALYNRAELARTWRKEMKLYYLRDNNEFVEVPLDVDKAEDFLRNEFDYGYTHGTLFCRPELSGFALHADGNEHLEEFIREARERIGGLPT
jgi:hypothetical protein